MCTILPVARSTLEFLILRSFTDTTFAATLMNGPVSAGGWLFADDKRTLELMMNREFRVLPHEAGGMVRIPLTYTGEGKWATHLEIVRIRNG